MTDDEKRQQKAMLLLECSETEQHLNHLQAKAKRMSDALDAVSRWISRTVGSKTAYDMSHIVVEIQNKKYDPRDPIIDELTSHQAILDLISEFKDTHAKLENLREQKRHFGLV